VPSGTYRIEDFTFAVEKERVFIIINRHENNKQVAPILLGTGSMEIPITTIAEAETAMNAAKAAYNKVKSAEKSAETEKILAGYSAAAQSVYAALDAGMAGALKKNPVMALFPLTAGNIDDRDIMYEYITREFANAQKYTLVEKSRLDELLAEYDFQRSGLVSEETMSIGELLQADAVIFATINGNDANKRLVVWVVDVKKRTLLATAQGNM
jgi:hypothetical protein